MNAEWSFRAGAVSGRNLSRQAFVSRIPSISQEILQCIAVGSLALASFFFISHFIFQSAQVVGASMMPTLHNADRCLVDHWIYYFRAPCRGDIVILKDPTDGKLAVKRVIATPGEAVEFHNGEIFVNNRRLDEPYLAPGTETFPSGDERAEIRCGKNSYFVLGDNRNDSFDSRIYGPIPRDNILGVVIQ